MKSLTIALTVYFLTIAVAFALPTSEGYDVFQWKLLIAQIYAVPAFIIALIISVLYFKNKATS